MPNNTQTVSGILPQLQKLYPSIHFCVGKQFSWSPARQMVTYMDDAARASSWALIHEVAHATLGHKHYKNDIDLLQHEVEAWSAAKNIGKNIGVLVEDDYIQDCLDTYRDWVHKRARCPACSVISLQQDDLTYKCFNCQTVWKVPASPLCRVSRIIIHATGD